MNNKTNIITAIDNKELKIQFAKINNYYCVTIFNKAKSDFEFLELNSKELVQLLSKYGDITYTTEYFKVNAYTMECFDRKNEEINILGYCFNYQL